MKKFLVTIFYISILLFSRQNNAQAQESSRLRISLLTCAPGDELYSIFGHSAIRITDSIRGTDYVYNYGTFNFDDDFYVKFMKGKLLYYVSVDEFENFAYNYQMMQRGITEQVLDLSKEEAESIQRALLENSKEENKYYKYDFFLDNCTTRIRDIISKFKKTQLPTQHVMPAKTRFREAIHTYLDRGGQQWSKLGIDILLGAPTDKVMTANEQQFLPDNLMSALDMNEKSIIIKEKKVLFQFDKKNESAFFSSPAFLFSMFLVLISLLSFSKNKIILNSLNIFDRILYGTTGLLGIILLLMWFATDHSMTKNNFNLLWAVPSHILLSFGLNSKKTFIKKYLFYTALLSGLTLISWFFLPQTLNAALIPVVLLILIRSLKNQSS
ncbi:MAG: DUF4105 domain-containing protein [Ferruginibacter sp.]|nr:DUF4105 domain-containing protein [Ferruginibacter sp.]